MRPRSNNAILNEIFDRKPKYNYWSVVFEMLFLNEETWRARLSLFSCEQKMVWRVSFQNEVSKYYLYKSYTFFVSVPFRWKKTESREDFVRFCHKRPGNYHPNHGAHFFNCGTLSEPRLAHTHICRPLSQESVFGVWVFLV